MWCWLWRCASICSAPPEWRPDVTDESVLACAVALSGLTGMTVKRLRLLWMRHTPDEAVAVARGEIDDPLLREHLTRWGRRPGDRRHGTDWPATWRAELDREPVVARYERFVAASGRAMLHGDHLYPPCLLDDPDAPIVLYYRGDPGAVDGRRVAVIGTRNASLTGRRAATEFGLRLAEHGVRVVSGLARGIDGAAHRGALAAKAAPPVGVVACGLDVVYPREHRDLWEAVASHGLLVSPKPPGVAPQAGAFPERNRILAALSEAVVVVESRRSGGSLITAHEADRRSITVLALPGSTGSRSSEGTNALLRDGGAGIVLEPDDVLAASLLDHRRAERRRYDPRPRPSATERELLDLIGGDAIGLDELAARSDRPLGEIAVELGRLEAVGWVTRSAGCFVALGAPLESESSMTPEDSR